MNKRKSGQFLLIISLIISILLLSIIAYVYSAKAYYTGLRYQATKEIIEAITADFKRALAYVLANATHTYLNESYGQNARHNFTIGRLYAYEFLSRWKQYITYVYSELGVQVDIEYPEKTIQLHDRTRKIANLTKCYWYYPESISVAFATLKLNITKYGLYNWKTNITVSLHAWIIENSFTSDQSSNTTTFHIKVLYDDQKPYPWLWEKGQIYILYPDPINYGDWLRAEIQEVEYLGNGVYNITIKPYLKLFQGTEQKVAPLKIILKDERGIVVELYSYKWIQLKITRNTPDRLNYKLIYDFNDGKQGWYAQDGPKGKVCQLEGGPSLFIPDNKKLRMRFVSTVKSWIGCKEGTVYLYSPKIYRAKYGDNYIEHFTKLEINVDRIYGCNCRLNIISDTGTLYDGPLVEGNNVYNLETLNIGNYIQLKIICTTTLGCLLKCNSPIPIKALLRIENVVIHSKSLKISEMSPEVYTLDFDWYLNLHWNGVNLGLTDIVWDFDDRLEGWFVVPEQPLNISIFGIYFSLHAIETELMSSNNNLILEFYKHSDLLNLNLPYEVWLNLYSPMININRERLDEYQNLTIRYKVDPGNDPSTSIVLRLQYLDKDTLEPVNLIWDDFPGEIELDCTDWKELTWNFSKCKNLPPYKIITIWIDIFAKTKSGDPQKLYIDYVKMPTKRSLVVPVPRIPVKQFRVNMSDDGNIWNIIPSQFEIWNNVNWKGWNVSEPKGLADFQVNFNSSSRIVFQANFDSSEREKYVRIWWNDDLDSQPIDWPSEINIEDNFITTNKLGVRFIDENNPVFYEFDETGWNWNGVAALIVKKKIDSSFKAIGLYDLHAYSIYNGLGARRPKGVWHILSIEYPHPYSYMKAPIRALVVLKTDKVGSPWKPGYENTYYSTFSIVNIINGVSYVPIHTRVYWLQDKSIMDSSLTAYWLYIISSKASNDMFFELQRKNNHTKVGEFEDIQWNWLYLSYVETVRNTGFLSSEWNDTISLAVVSNLEALRTQNIFYMNSGGYPLGDHPPPFLLARKESKYYIESLLKAPRASLSILFEIKKNTALFFPTVIQITDHAEGLWAYHYLFTPMFLEPYMPTFNVTIHFTGS